MARTLKGRAAAIQRDLDRLSNRPRGTSGSSTANSQPCHEVEREAEIGGFAQPGDQAKGSSSCYLPL